METRKMEEQLALIEQRLAAVERVIGVSAPAPKPAVAPAAPVPPVTRPVEPAKPGNWLGLIAVVCFVLAAGLIIKLTLASGWMTPARQIGLAAMLGLGLVGAGLALVKSDRAYAGYLPGAGVIVLYLTVFAAHRYFGLISFVPAIMLTALVSALCIWLYTRIRHDVYAITAAVGAYLAPVVVGIHSEGLFAQGYFLLCSLAFALVAVWVESRVLTLVSAYLAILMAGVSGFDVVVNWAMAVMLAMHFLIFSLSTLGYSLRNRQPLTQREAMSFLPVLLIFYAMEYLAIQRIHPGAAPWVMLGFAGALIGLYLLAKERAATGAGSHAMLVSFATLVVFHAFYLEILPDALRPWLMVALLAAAAWLPVTRFAGEGGAGVYTVPVLAVLAVVAMEYWDTFYRLVDRPGLGAVPVAVAAFASLWVLLLRTNGTIAGRYSCAYILLTAAHALAIVALYRLVNPMGSFAVSASWLLYAVGVIAFAFRRKDEVMARSALFVLTFAAGKALLFDASSTPSTWRIFCLLLTGAVLYGCGLLMRRISGWKQE